VPEGSIAMAGIGCHGMAVSMSERRTVGIYHMGGEGAPWIGQAPFVDTPHIFQNLGDGTYFHSGLLALRACVAAGVNITYKILLNGAVGMTGGQPIEGEQFAGEITAPHVASQVQAEGVRRIAVVTDDLEKFGDRRTFPATASFHHRDDLDAVQRELRDWKGVSVLIYDQSCATERRRLRKRGKVAKATTRMYIQPDVCEGCGDCGVQSNCIAIEPLDTDLGRKRQINQSVCNQDLSCLKGFCPSFVAVTGGRVRAKGGQQGGADQEQVQQLAEPLTPALTRTFSVLVTGIGGSGVVTIGAILGMAAHLESKRATVLDMSGFAQRNGSVMSHVRFAAADESGHSARIPPGSADVILGCDPIVAASPEAQSMMSLGRTAVVINRFVAPTSAFALNPDFRVDLRALERLVALRVGADRLFGTEATQVAAAILGDAIGANLFVVGYAWQKGLIPLQRASIVRAIELNGSAREMNIRAFGLGRLAAAAPGSLQELLGERRESQPLAEQDLASIVTRRATFLTSYQNAQLAERYRAVVDRVEKAERTLGCGQNSLSKAVAHVYAKLLAYKDEYEVARLFTREEFTKQLEQTFEGNPRISFNLAPPWLARRNRATGRLRKMELGPWILGLFRILARLRVLRGTPLDLFGYSAHRRMERRLIQDYEALVDRLLRELTPDNYTAAVELAKLADMVRGYDVVKEENVAKMRKRETELWSTFMAARRPQDASSDSVRKDAHAA
jgi:indolepyruvate ferredoxin oxidoreductase